MVVVSMSSMPSNVIGRETCLWIKSLYKPSKDFGTKRHWNIWRREESKETREPMKVGEGGVHHNRYDGHCMQQWVKIPKVTWTSFILGRNLTCWTSFNMAFLIKDHVKGGVPNGIPKTPILCDGVSKLGGKPKMDHATYLWGWIERPIAQSLVWKWSYVNDTIEGLWCECYLQLMEINKRD